MFSENIILNEYPKSTGSTLHSGSFPHHENPLLSRAMLFQQTSALLSLKGKDCLDFLQRLSTNELLSLKPAQSRITILTTEKAKIVDLCTLVRTEHLLLMALESCDVPKIIKWLDHFLFSEDVQIQDVSNEYDHYLVAGSSPKEYLKEVFDIEIVEAQDGVNYFSIANTDGMVYYNSLWQIPVYNILIKKNESGREPFPGITIENDITILETMRIEQGVPKFTSELSEQVNPLEAGLERFISWTKGCYTGQEVIARLDTYKKLQRKLTGFVFDELNQQQLEPGELFLEGNKVGWTTSHIWSTNLNHAIALGYLRTGVESSTVQFRNASFPDGIQATVSQLPFKAL